MAITKVTWEGSGYDIHLLKGEKSQPLNRKLKAKQTTGNTIKDFRGDGPPAGVTVQFLGLFKGAPNNHGVTVSAIGEVSIAHNLPAKRLFNFLLRAVVSESGGNSLETHIRIHIHETVNKIWLTPASLTLYQGSKQRFTVLAEFDDKTVGDITERNSAVVISSPINELKFERISVNPDKINVDPAKGELTVLRPNEQQEVSVSMVLDPGTGSMLVRRSKATVNTKPSLAQPRKIVRVRGKGPVNFDQKVNILFVGDGFDASEKDLFNQIVDQIARELQTSPRTFPYNALEESINYWRLEDADFIASIEQNVTVLGEMDVKGRRSMSGTLVPFPLKPLPTAIKWTLENMVYMVGMPVTADAGRSLEQKAGDWKALYQDFDSGKIDPAVFVKWRDMADRTIVNERDTALGIVINGHSRADEDPDRVIEFHERRITSNEFLLFVDKLQIGSTTVGTTWRTGKDKGLICLVARSARHAGVEMESHFAHTLGSNLEDRLRPSTRGPGIELVAMELTKADKTLVSLDAALISTLAHEFAHALGLEDEYGVDAPTFPISSILEVSGLGNVQPESEIVFPLTASIDAENIRWNLPRIKAAGLLAAAPTPSGSNFTVRLTAPAVGFKKDDIVRFRKRKFLTDTSLDSQRLRVFAIDQDVVTVVPAQGTTINPADFPTGSRLISRNTGASGILVAEPAAPSMHGGTAVDVELKTGHARYFNTSDLVRLRRNPFSDRFKLAGDPVGSNLTLTPLPGSKPRTTDFGADDVLVATVPAPGNPVGADLSLIAPIILGHIASSNKPLNAKKGSAKHTCVPGQRTDVVTPTNLPNGLPKDRPRNKAHIVGLYDGGHRYDCGIFHPAGLCMMNDSKSKRTDRFCQVCRYLLIDRVDPTKHKELDAIYKNEYPQP